MDIADDIAYATHDLEDALKAGFITPLEVVSSLRDESLIEAVAKDARISPKKVCELLFDAFWQESELRLPQTAQSITDVTQSPPSNWPEFESLESLTVQSIIDAYRKSKLLSSDGYARAAFHSSLVREFVYSVQLE